MTLRHPLRTLGFRLLPGLCLCCGLPSGRPLDLCPGCEAALPVLGPGCPRCAIPLPTPALCGECLRQPPAFARVIACHSYGPPVKGLILALKQRRDLAAGRVLGELLAARIAATLPADDRPDLLVPVPLHWRRRLGRGFNQALELARPVAAALGIALAPGLARRIRHLTQEDLGRDARRRQLRGAFRVTRPLAGERIALVDDVVTTTGTARALADALRRAGAGRVEVWCMARTPLEK
ncbi:MAG: ComF family protein [Pseudomonadota bacterium]|nr:ComF family protein [Pseudomonadota bacterium]